MVNHIVFWNFKPELTEQEREEAGKMIRQSLEAVREKAEGVIRLEVRINELASSNKDIALISSFETVEALNAYQMCIRDSPCGRLYGGTAEGCA